MSGLGDMHDQAITCPDCGHPFLWTVKDQAFYQERGFTPPKRCKSCRLKRQRARDEREDKERGRGR